MSNNKGSFMDLMYKTIMPKVYGIGAAVVIMGAMFKILHLPGASAMLGVGLSVEAVIFFLSAFEPASHEVDWTKVYPELAEDYEGGPRESKKMISKGGSSDAVSQKLDKMLEDAKIGPELVESLGHGMRRLSDNVAKMANMGDVGAVTTEYTANLKKSADLMGNVNKSYEVTLKAMQEMAQVSNSATADMANSAKDAKEYHTQVQTVTKNLEALNAVYELELQDTNKHVKAMGSFYSSLTSSLDGMTKATQDAEAFNREISKLTTNISALNKVYGNMLTALKS
jgi:gliding motility-associated protein GldL